MLGLPAATEIRKVIPKKKVYEHFASEMNADRRKSFDADIARITVYNELSKASINVADGAEVHAVFVVLVNLKTKTFDKQNIAFIAKMFGQHQIIVLNVDEMESLAIWQTKLIMNDWRPEGEQKLEIRGLNMDGIWESLVTQIGGFKIAEGNTLNEQIAVNEKKEKLKKELEKLEKQAWVEKQPKRKMELYMKIKEIEVEVRMM